MVDRPIKATVYTRGGGTHQNYWETPDVIKKNQKFMADFHYGDVHVSLLGSYLTASVIFAEIYNRSPEGLPSVFHEYKIDKDTARILQATAWETVQEWQKIQREQQ